MNYDEAREIPGKGWHWTTMNNGVVRTAQPCIQIPEMSVEDLMRKPLMGTDITPLRAARDQRGSRAALLRLVPLDRHGNQAQQSAASMPRRGLRSMDGYRTRQPTTRAHVQRRPAL